MAFFHTAHALYSTVPWHCSCLGEWTKILLKKFPIKKLGKKKDRPFLVSVEFLLTFPFRLLATSELQSAPHSSVCYSTMNPIKQLKRLLSFLSSSLLLSTLSAIMIINISILCHIMLCPGIDFSACWTYLDPTGGWCLVEGCPGVLLCHLFNVKPVQKELASDGFALKPDPVFYSKDNAGKDQQQCQGFC